MRKGAIRAWCLYDWANSAFATTVIAALFPPFFRRVAIEAGLAGSTATAYWGYTTAIALLLIAVAAPILGAIADFTGHKKRYLGCCAGLGILFTAAMALIGAEAWRLAAVVFIGGNLGFAGSIVFYESLLPHLAAGDDIDRISARGYALGYAGGGLLLIINALWLLRPDLWGLPDTAFAVKASFLSVALWWGMFSVPLFRHVPEPEVSLPAGRTGNPLRGGLARLAETWREVARFRQLLIFLVAFWVYNDGIGTIIKMATAFGDEIGIELTDMILALVLTQLIGIPCTLLLGRLAGRVGARTVVLMALAVYVLICVGGFFMRTATHFFLLAGLVGTVQGGAQALSRSLFGAMVPRHKSAEFFGFFSTSGKFAGIAGPVLFGLVSQLTGQSRLSIVSLIVFFVVGGVLLARVDVAAGKRAARAAEVAHR